MQRFNVDAVAAFVLLDAHYLVAGQVEDVSGHGHALPSADQCLPSRHAAMNERDQESLPSGLRLSTYGQDSMENPA